MSSFGARRKARVISVADDDDQDGSSAGAESSTLKQDGELRQTFSQPPLTQGTRLTRGLFVDESASGVSFKPRKPLRQSGLRKAYNADDEPNIKVRPDSGDVSEEDEGGPVVQRPGASRGASSKLKRRSKPALKLSFGGPAAEADDDEGPRKPAAQMPKRDLGTRGLPMRSQQGDDDDRPKYSREYLSELQSSTPNTPADLSSVPTDADEMDLDPSELEGALIVDMPSSTNQQDQTSILTDAEIREKKERRVRLAQEQDFISFEDDDNLGRKKKDDSRLVAEGDDMGEGFDRYVEDGGLSLGKRATKERRKHERVQMAEMINAAEGDASDSSSDSDAERRIAYEAAQTRAGLDGLDKPRKDPAEELLQVPSKITPIPTIAECLSRLQVTLGGLQRELTQKRLRVEELRRESNEITVREAEVQGLLDETGKKYQEAMGRGGSENGDAIPTAPLAAAHAELAGERGLDSLGTTPGHDDTMIEGQ